MMLITNICYSANNENFSDDLDMVIDDVLYNQCASIDDAKEATIYVGESMTPKLKAEWLFDYMKERAEECVYEQCGEYADNFHATTDYDLALKSHIQQWIDRLVYNCYTVKKVKEESIMSYVTEQDLQDFFKD